MRRPLERPLAATVWELRAAWASRREVSLRFDGRASYPRARGTVEHVAASGVYVQLLDPAHKGGPIHVPTAIILSVRTPHFTEPVDRREEIPEALAGQLSIYDVLGEEAR